jgi:hypothetical protein
MDPHPRPAPDRRTRRCTLGTLPEPVRTRLAEQLEKHLFEVDPSTTTWLTEGAVPAPPARGLWSRWTSAPGPGSGVLTTVVLASGRHLLIGVDPGSGLALLRGPLDGIDTRDVVLPGSAGSSPADVTVNGLGHGPDRSSYVVRTGDPDGPALRGWIEDAVRAARS